MRYLEIYIHIPFCVKKCDYCDFLSFAADKETQERYVEELKKEILQWKGRGDETVSTVFFGGGTPSLLPGGWICAIMEALRERFPFQEGAEITIECNPGTLDAEKPAMYRAAGINRLSLGLQSADDGELCLLGRIHTWKDFLESYQTARAAGFANINVDLMSALPGQTYVSWEKTLGRVLALEPEHISAYSLMIEEGTPFYARYAEDVKKREQGLACVYLPSEEEERRMYLQTKELLQRYGYDRYEISNYARPGRECVHNCGYWERREYLGFGLGAASLLDNCRFSNTSRMEDYLRGVRSAQPAQRLSVKEQMEETMFLGLRMMRGVSMADFAETYGVSMDSVYGDVLSRLEKLGLVRTAGGRVRLTERGIDVSNYALSEFLLE